jgi:arsenite/tail-anchored protein-transporting ATPase
LAHFITLGVLSQQDFFLNNNNLQEIDPKVENDDLSSEGMEGFLSELTNAIPGVDEAMSFAEMLK